MKPSNLAGRTVIIVDDDEILRQYISLQLRNYAVQVLEAADSAELFELMKSDHIGCILMDYDLAPENGLFVQAQLRERFGNVPPVIILSATEDPRTVIKAFRTGASDYLMKKGLRVEDLVQSVQSAIARRDDDDAIRDEIEHLRKNSIFDEATGFYRREAMENMLADIARGRARSGRAFAILLIRVNQFDGICEQSGQVAAQKLIRAFAARLKGVVRTVDVCGRFDAKTFICHVDVGADPRLTATLTTRLDQALCFDLDLDAISLSVSATIASAVYPDDAEDPISLVRVAEAALDGPGAIQRRGAGAAGDPTEQSVIRQGNRRKAPRRRVLKQGRIVVDGGTTILDCIVRDLSDTGARVRLAGIFLVPATFDLDVAGDGAARSVQRVWQRGGEVGLAFTASPHAVVKA